MVGGARGVLGGVRDALLLAAGEFLRTARAPAFGADEPQRLERAGPDLGRGQLVRVEREGGVFEHGQVREQRIVLVSVPEAARRRLGVGDVAVVQEHRAALRLALAGQRLEQGRLAAAGRTQETAERAGLDDEVDAVEDRRIADLAAQAGDAKGGHAANLGGRPAREQGRSAAAACE